MMSPPESAPRTPTPGSLLDPERAGIQARTSDPVKYSPTQRPYTASRQIFLQWVTYEDASKFSFNFPKVCVCICNMRSLLTAVV